MSLLDLEFDSPEALVQQVNDMMPVMDGLIEDLGLSDNDAVQSVREGISPHIILGLSDEHLDAIFVTGLNLAQAGNTDQAQVVFLKLATLKAHDYRFWYALGTTLQLQQKLAEAVRAYLMSLSLRATDVDAYLRMGECLLAAEEFENALGCFQMAQALCADGHGQDDQRQAADGMIAFIAEQMQVDTSSPYHKDN
ncbi:MAG: hypothetical protein AAFQ09_12125 [Pseudomonadota bacterium]